VLLAAAKAFDWSGRRQRNPNQPGHGIGLACGTEKGSYVAACAEVEVVDESIKVRQVCQAFECGAIQSPANLKMQVEGCLIMGLGAALTEEIAFADGRITNPQFSSYRVPRSSDVPELETMLVERQDLPSVGAGETPIIAVAPAIANAVDHAVGVRCRSMPLRQSSGGLPVSRVGSAIVHPALQRHQVLQKFDPFPVVEWLEQFDRHEGVLRDPDLFDL
jgi:CO/xanthine dehydrogenase Mo-binding subunit